MVDTADGPWRGCIISTGAVGSFVVKFDCSSLEVLPLAKKETVEIHRKKRTKTYQKKAGGCLQI